MAGQASQAAIDFGRLSAAGALNSGGSDHVPQRSVATADSLPNSGNGSPTISAVTGGGLGSSVAGTQGELDNLAKASDANQLTSLGNVGQIFEEYTHAMEGNALDVFDGAHAPFGLLKEGAVPNIQGSGNIALQNLAPGEQVSAKLQGNTGIMSPSQGQSH